MTLILASSSPFRQKLMADAGLSFTAIAATIDERALELPLASGGASASEIATALATAKAMSVAALQPEALVIGSDQTLSLGNRQFHKPASLEEARGQLLDMAGKTHQLNSAISICQNNKLLWSHVSRANMTMRPLSGGFVDRYLARAGDSVKSSVGAYQLEGLGLQLFESIDGDYFTILGLPMLPLLKKLRELGAIDG